MGNAPAYLPISRGLDGERPSLYRARALEWTHTRLGAPSPPCRGTHCACRYTEIHRDTPRYTEIPTVRAHPATLPTVKRGGVSRCISVYLGVSRRDSRRRGELKLHSIQRLAQLSAHLTTQDYVLFMDSDMILRQPIDPVAMGRGARRVFLFHSGVVFLF